MYIYLPQAVSINWNSDTINNQAVAALPSFLLQAISPPWHNRNRLWLSEFLMKGIVFGYRIFWVQSSLTRQLLIPDLFVAMCRCTKKRRYPKTAAVIFLKPQQQKKTVSLLAGGY